MILTLSLFVLGGGLLFAGAEMLVRGASRIAFAAGISPLVVGLTVVAFGTSSPELAVTLGGVFSGQADIALGNVVGSNVANVLLILGVAAAVRPLVVSRQLVRLDVPLLIVVSTAVLAMALDGEVGRLDGGLLVVTGILYTAFVVRLGRRGGAVPAAAINAPADPAGGVSWKTDLVLIAAGLAALVLGARWLVDGAVAAARALGVSELVIGLTVVAIGTSLPELATSLLAVVRGERDLAVGNVVGSCLYNLVLVLGVGALATPGGVPVARAAVAFDLPVMLATAVACLPIFFVNYTISRWEGWVLLGYYAAYLLYVILDAAEHDALPAFSLAMGLFVIPLTVLTLAVVSYRSLRHGRS